MDIQGKISNLNIWFLWILSIFPIQFPQGHNQTVLSFMWSVDDRYLVSAGLEGSVYQWSMDKGVKMLDFVKKGTEHRSLVLRNDMSSIYSVTQTGYIREIGVESMEIGKEIKTPNLYPLTSIVMARTEMFMFASTERGQLYNVQVPFSESAGGTCVNFRFFNTAIVKLQMSFDDCTLITASADGTLVVWSILNIEGKMLRCSMKRRNLININLVSRKNFYC